MQIQLERSTIARISDYPLGIIIQPYQANYKWAPNGSRWVFADVAFMEKRETVGLDSHVIHFHSQFVIDNSGGPGITPTILEAPVVVFRDLQSLTHFKLML